MNYYQKLMNSQDLKRKKGKFTPFIHKNRVIEVQKVYTFESSRPYFPFILILTKSNSFLGITLARQSSDFLSFLAIKMRSQRLAEEAYIKLHESFIVQYRLPKDQNSLKLILLMKWEQEQDYNPILSRLNNFQQNFRKSLGNIVTTSLNTENK